MHNHSTFQIRTMGTVILWILGSVAFILFCGALSIPAKEAPQSDKQVVPPSVWNKPREIEFKETPDPEGEPMSKFSCAVAGIKFHEISVKVGGFLGYAAPEPDNSYDPDAVAIYNHETIVIGYVPRKAQDEYMEYFPDRAPAFVAGYVNKSSDDKLSGKAYFVRVHSWEYARYELVSLCVWMKKKKGIDTFNGYEEVLHKIDAQIAQKRADNNSNDTNITDSATSV